MTRQVIHNWVPMRWVLITALVFQTLMPVRGDDESLRRQVRSYRDQNCAYWVAQYGELAWSVISERTTLAAIALEDGSPYLAAELLNHPGIDRLPRDYVRMIDAFVLLSAVNHQEALWTPSQEMERVATLRDALEEWSDDAELADQLAEAALAKNRANLAAGKTPAMARRGEGAFQNLGPIPSSGSARRVGSPPGPPGGGGVRPPDSDGGRPFESGWDGFAVEAPQRLSPIIAHILLRIAELTDADDDRENNILFPIVSEPCEAGAQGWLRLWMADVLAEVIRDRLTSEEESWAWFAWTRTGKSLMEVARELVSRRIELALGRALSDAERSETLDAYFDRREELERIVADLESCGGGPPLGQECEKAPPVSSRPKLDHPEANPPAEATAEPPVRDVLPVELRANLMHIAGYAGVSSDGLRELRFSSLEASPATSQGVTDFLEDVAVGVDELGRGLQPLFEQLDRIEAGDPDADPVLGSRSGLLGHLDRGFDPGQIRRTAEVTLLRAFSHEGRWQEMLYLTAEIRERRGQVCPVSVQLDEGERFGVFTSASLDNMISLLELRALIGKAGQGDEDADWEATLRFLTHHKAYSPYLDIVDGESVFLRPLARLVERGGPFPDEVELVDDQPSMSRLKVRAGGRVLPIRVYKIGGRFLALVERP